MQDTEYSPYCPICNGCGEESCCSPMSCEQSPDGSYCKSYLIDLKFAYAMNKFFEEKISSRLPHDLKAEYDMEWDYMLERHYNPPIPITE